MNDTHVRCAVDLLDVFMEVVCMRSVIVSVLVYSWVMSSTAFAEGFKPELFKKEILPLLDKYCYRCHDDKKQKGDIRLDIYKDAKQILPNRKHWLLVLEQLETREMPTKKPLPTEAEYQKLIHYVEKAANDVDWDKVKHPGHVTIPLLTKEEYYNTLEELLGLDLEAHSTFSEDSEGISGFTNDRDGLFVSTSKMEKYLQTAEAAIDSVIAVNKGAQNWKLESEKMFMTETREAPRNLGKDFFGYILNRGQMSLYDSIDIPADGVYEVTVRVKSGSPISAAVLRVDNKELAVIENEGKEANVHKAFIHVSKGSRQFTWNIGTPKQQRELENIGRVPKKEEIAASKPLARKNKMKIPKEISSAAKKGKYNLRRLNNEINGLQYNIEELKVYGVDGTRKTVVKLHSTAKKQMKGLRDELSKISKKLKIQATAIFNKLNKTRLKENNDLLKKFDKVKLIKGGAIGIDWMALRGPLSNLGKPVLSLKATGNTDESAKKILREFLPRAFRKPVTEADIEKYFSLFSKAKSQGESFENSIKLALTAVLVSPRFLFRDELKKTDEVYQLDDYQIASRLSYFLWMSMPDKELFDLAAKGELKKPEILKTQLKRMLADKRSRNFVSAFAGEWLGFKALGHSVMPDEKRFPHYSREFSEVSKLETILILEDLFKNNGSLLNLIDTNYTYANEELAKHYDIPNVKGSEMRRVELLNRNRGGLMGMASILTATSNPSRTSPVNRGMWIFENLLGQHMGTPPADVPPLPENAGNMKNKTLRQVFEEHRDNPACSTCHDKIDPLGFGMENFDAIGRYRNSQNGKKIDASGKMPDGSKFVGIVELKEYILKKKKNEFLRNVSERLLSFCSR